MSLHLKRVDNSASSINFLSFIKESIEDSERKKIHRVDRRVVRRGEAPKPKMKFLKFNDDDPNTWINEAEHYFENNPMKVIVKVSYVTSLRGRLINCGSG